VTNPVDKERDTKTLLFGKSSATTKSPKKPRNDFSDALLTSCFQNDVVDAGGKIALRGAFAVFFVLKQFGAKHSQMLFASSKLATSGSSSLSQPKPRI